MLEPLALPIGDGQQAHIYVKPTAVDSKWVNPSYARPPVFGEWAGEEITFHGHVTDQHENMFDLYVGVPRTYPGQTQQTLWVYLQDDPCADGEVRHDPAFMMQFQFTFEFVVSALTDEPDPTPDQAPAEPLADWERELLELNDNDND